MTNEDFVIFHTHHFPNATLSMQMRKFVDEKKEYKAEDEKQKAIKELADCYIVALSIKLRFDDEIGDMFLNWVEIERLKFRYLESTFEKELKNKIEEIKNRKYKLQNNQYQHVEPRKAIDYKTGKVIILED